MDSIIFYRYIIFRVNYYINSKGFEIKNNLYKIIQYSILIRKVS